MSRRHFLARTALAALAPSLSLHAASEEKFFSLAKKKGRWWFITPEGNPFFSIALNHIDPAPLRYLEKSDLWVRKYGNSMERWLKESVAPDLREWGFNSVGWTQEVVTRGPTNQRHSRAYTFEEYQWLGLPYCHQLPFADYHQWEVETRHPDFHCAEWCDYVAREHCIGKKHAAYLRSRPSGAYSVRPSIPRHAQRQSLCRHQRHLAAGPCQHPAS